MEEFPGGNSVKKNPGLNPFRDISRGNSQINSWRNLPENFSENNLEAISGENARMNSWWKSAEKLPEEFLEKNFEVISGGNTERNCWRKSSEVFLERTAGRISGRNPRRNL